MLFISSDNLERAQHELAKLNNEFGVASDSIMASFNPDTHEIIPKVDNPGIFLVVNRETREPEGILKSGVMRALDSLVLNRVAEILGFDDLFPKSKISIINLSKFFDVHLIRQYYPRRSEQDLEPMVLSTTDPRGDFHIKPVSVLERDQFCVVSQEEYIHDAGIAHSDYQPFDVLKIIVFAYLFYIKDIKDNGLIADARGPKLVDAEENVLKTLSYLPAVTARQQEVASMGLHIMGDWQDNEIRYGDLVAMEGLLSSHQDAVEQNLKDLASRLIDIRALLNNVMIGPKFPKPVLVHAGHEIIDNPVLLGEKLLLRFRHVLTTLGEFIKTATSNPYGRISVLDFVEKLDPIYGKTYREWLAISNPEDDAASRSLSRLTSSSLRNPAAHYTGSITFPHSPEYKQRVKLEKINSDLKKSVDAVLTSIDNLLDVIKDEPDESTESFEQSEGDDVTTLSDRSAISTTFQQNLRKIIKRICADIHELNSIPDTIDYETPRKGCCYPQTDAQIQDLDRAIKSIQAGRQLLVDSISKIVVLAQRVGASERHLGQLKDAPTILNSLSSRLAAFFIKKRLESLELDELHGSFGMSSLTPVMSPALVITRLRDLDVGLVAGPGRSGFGGDSHPATESDFVRSQGADYVEKWLGDDSQKMTMPI